MIWLVGFSICILLLAGDVAGDSPEPDAFWTCSLVLFAAFTPPFMACIQSRLIAMRWGLVNIRQDVAPGILRRIRVSNFLVWFSSSAAIMIVLDWPSLVRGSWSLGQIPLVDEIVIAIPVMASSIFSWVVVHSSVQEAESELSGLFRIGQLNFALAIGQMRTFGGLVCLPVMILFLIRDMVTMVLPQEYMGLALGAGGALFFILLTGLYPVIVATTWKTGPLPGESLQAELRRTAMERGMRPIPVRVWFTNDLIVNAVIVGLIPGTRKVFLTDGLLKHFRNREVLAIFRHELGHIAGRHLWIRLLVLISPILVATLASWSILESGRFSNFPAGNSWLFGLGLAGFVGTWWLVSVRIFRYCEISADRFAILDANGKPCPELAEDYCSALLKIAMVNPESWSRRSMIHPSIRARVQAVAACAGMEPFSQLKAPWTLDI